MKVLRGLSKEDRGVAFTLRLRHRSPDGRPRSFGPIVEEERTCLAPETAILVCDMWDSFPCREVARRAKDLAGPLNRLLQMARRAGMLVVHSPSRCMAAYESSPQVRRFARVPPAKDLPEDIDGEIYSLPGEPGPASRSARTTE